MSFKLGVSPKNDIFFERSRSKITVCLRDSKEMRIAANLVANGDNSAADLLFKFDSVAMILFRSWLHCCIHLARYMHPVAKRPYVMLDTVSEVAHPVGFHAWAPKTTEFRRPHAGS